MAELDWLLIPYEEFEYARFDLVGRYGNGNQFMAFVNHALPGDWGIDNYTAEYLRTR